MTCRSKNSTRVASEAGSSAAEAGTAGLGAIGATGFAAGAVGLGTGEGGAVITADSVLSGGVFTGALSVPAGTGAPSGTRAVGVPMVSPGLIGGGGVRRASAGAAACGVGTGVEEAGAVGADIVSGDFVCGAAALDAGAGVSVTGAAVIVDPTAVFARAVGVLRSAAVDAIGVEPAVTAFAPLGAGAPASIFTGGAGLNESRIFVAATTSCARI